MRNKRKSGLIVFRRTGKNFDLLVEGWPALVVLGAAFAAYLIYLAH